MPWYRYVGNIVRPIQKKKGVTAAVRPHSKVEIVELTPETRVLIRKRILVPASPDKAAKPVEKVTPPNIAEMKEALPRSSMSAMVAEKGKTDSRNKPPKSKHPEYTVGEIEDVGVEKGAEEADVLPDAADADPADEGETGKRKRRRRK